MSKHSFIFGYILFYYLVLSTFQIYEKKVLKVFIPL